MKNSIDIQIQETIQVMMDYYKSHNANNRVVVIPFLQESITYTESNKINDLTISSNGRAKNARR